MQPTQPQTEEERKIEVERRQRIYKATHSASEVKDVPLQAHFAVLCNNSFSYDDGYGSHGMPSMSTHRQMDYIVFDSEEALNAWIIENHTKKTYRVINVKAVEVELKTTITVKP